MGEGIHDEAQSAASTSVPVDDSSPPVPLTSASFRAVELPVARLAAKLPHRLDDEEDAVHARVRVAQPAAAGVQREVAARRRPLPRDEVRALAPAAEAQPLQRHQRRVRERVVHHRQVDVVVRDARGLQRGGARHPRHRRGQVRHLADDGVVVALRAGEHPHGLLAQVARPLCRRDDDGRAGVGDEAAVEQVEGPRDPARVVVVVEGHRVAHHRLGVELRPLARGHRDLRQRLPCAVLAVLVHVARAGQRVVDRRADEAVGRLVLLAGHVGLGETPAAARAPHPLAPSRLPVRDERDLAVPRVDGRHRVGDVDDEGRAADGRRVREARVDAQVLARREGGEARGEEPIDVVLG